MMLDELLSSMDPPNTAKMHIPQVLSLEIQKRLINDQNPESILLHSIEAINNGSIKTLDKLVREQLK